MKHPEYWILIVGLLTLLVFTCTGCAQLPPGSYARLATGYGKDGPSGKAVLHIPLGRQ
jgi:hypothetical protein